MARREPPTRTSDLSQQIEESANEGKKSETSRTTAYTLDDLIPTGSTLLNLALSGYIGGGWKKGTMVNVIGDSSAGKSFVVLTTLAEMHTYSKFDEYELIYDDVENANSFDMEYLFGNSFKDRVIAPNYDDEEEESYSDMIEDFQLNFIRALQEGPCVYCLDSFDALTAEADEKKSMEMLEAREKGKEVKGTYGMAKAKKSSEILRQNVKKLKKTKSLLCIVSQTRDNVDPLSFQKKTRAGGKALKFYASHELWLTNGGAIKSKDRIIGVKCKVKISKNKLTGKIREVSFPIFYDYGIDDIGSCVDFLIKEKHWKKSASGSKITTNELLIDPCTRASVIKQIESKGLEKKLSEIVGAVWHDIEDSLKLNRKSKY